MKLVIIFLLCTANLWASEISFSGIAHTDKGKKTFLYTEKHAQTLTDNKLSKDITKYLDKNGKEIAFLETNYKKNQFFPDFHFLDKRTGHREKLNTTSDSFKISVDDKTKTFKVKDGACTGQGINMLIESNLAKLAKKQNITIKYFLAERMMYATLLVKGKVSGDKVIARIMVKNFFLRLFAPKIEVIYDLKTKRLLSYYGVSNILTTTGKSQKVYIEYKY